MDTVEVTQEQADALEKAGDIYEVLDVTKEGNLILHDKRYQFIIMYSIMDTKGITYHMQDFYGL